ncbi:MAG: glycosyltransferase family 4 protein, partial [bacterium]
VDLFIAPSKFMKDACVRFGIPGNKIKVVYNFVSRPEHWIMAGRSEQEGRYILYFGRLSPEKGIDDLLEAMAMNQESKKAIKQESNKGKGHEEEQKEIEKLEIKKFEKDTRDHCPPCADALLRHQGDLSNLKLKIVGSGIEFKKLEDKIKELGLEDKVELVGQKFGQELVNIIKGAKAVILPSIWNENMPFSMLETMAAGKAVIASRTGGIPEMITDKETGFLFEMGNIDELAKKITDLDKYDLGAIGAAARKKVVHFNEEKHYGEIMEIYESVVNRTADNRRQKKEIRN